MEEYRHLPYGEIQERNQAKEASEMIAERKTAKCRCILIETEPNDDVDQVEVQIC